VNPMLQFQNAVRDKLLSEALLQNINIVSLRAQQLVSEEEAKRAWLKIRNGKSGAGVIVGMPSIEHNTPNVPGPERVLLLPVSILEQPSINSLPSTGTGLDCETIVDLIDALLARLQVEGLGTIFCEATVPNLETKSGVIRYDCIYTAAVPRAEIQRVTLPAYVCPAQTVTLTNAAGFEDAVIVYTDDETFPGLDPVTAQPLGTAHIYSAPIGPLAVGKKISWAAYKEGFAGSDVGQITIT